MVQPFISVKFRFFRKLKLNRELEEFEITIQSFGQMQRKRRRKWQNESRKSNTENRIITTQYFHIQNI